MGLQAMSLKSQPLHLLKYLYGFTVEDAPNIHTT